MLVALLSSLLVVAINAEETQVFEYTGSYQYYTEGYFLVEIENFGYQVEAEISVNYTYNCEPTPETKTSSVDIQHSELGKIWVVVPTQPPSVPELCYGDPVLNNVNVNVLKAELIPQEVPNEPPSVEIVQASPTEGEVPLTIDFTGTWEDDQGIVRWEWIFGDGSTFEGESQDIIATHTYTEPGSYLVFLKAWDEQEAVGYDFMIIKAYVKKPAIVGDIYIEGPAHTFVDIGFDCSSLFEGQEDYVETYEWDFGDGNIAIGMNTNNEFTDEGLYVVTLTLIYFDGTSKDIHKEIEITPNEPPFPSLQIDGPCRVGTAMTFDASGTTDPEGDELTYIWDLGDGQTAEGKTVEHTYLSDGTYSVILHVSDGMNETSTTESFEIIVNHPPVPMFTVSEEREIDNEIIFDAGQSYDEDGDEIEYYWEFGDGQTAEGRTVKHIFNETGSFDVKLMVTDSFISVTATETIDIEEDGDILYYILPIVIIGIGLLAYIFMKGSGRRFQDIDLVKKGY